MIDDVVFRQGKLVYLRPLKPLDAPTLQRWVNDQNVMQYMMRVHPASEREENEWIENQGKSQTDIPLAIVTVEGSKLIGTIGLHRINLVHRTATTGTMIGDKEYWGKGYGTEAKMLLLDLAFNALDLHSILSHVLSSNGRSLAYGKKCGYEEIGRIPNWIRLRNGTRCDDVMLVVTQERWRPLWEKYLEEQDRAN